MVAIFTGLGAGAERGSASVLGNSGLLGSGTLGRSGERVLLNAATGNLMVQQQDEMLVGRGPDSVIGRTYNSRGDLTDDNGDNWRMSTDRRVYGLTGTANTAGSTVKRVSADGSEITYAWSTSVAAYVATDGSGAYDTLAWTSSTTTWTWTDGDSQATETYAYAASNGRYLISKATDAKGNALTFTYLAGGKLDRVTTADGGYTQYGWSGTNITQITTGYTDLATNTAKTLTRTRYGYDASNRLTTVTVDLSPADNSIADGKTYVTTYGYDGTSKRVASIAQTDGSSLAITYDASGRVKTMVQTVATGTTRTTTLDYQTGYTTVTDPLGQVTRLDYDAGGQLTKITAPAAVTGAVQQVTQFGYTANGDLTSVIDPLGNTTSYTNFTAFGDAQTITDRLGNAVTRTFGSKNELLTETATGADQTGAAVQNTTRYVYDSNDRVRFEISPDGNVVEHRYDDTKGGVEVLTVTYTGQLYSLTGLTATQTPTLAQMTNWAAAADQTALEKVAYQYDARGNMTQRAGYGTLDAAGAGTPQSSVYYTYDQAGQLLSTNGYQHAAETYVYDGLGRVTASVDLAGGTTSIVFNDAATTTVVTLAGGLVQTSTYDKAGALVSMAETGAATAVGTASYKYDALGRVRMATDATGHNSYVLYDKAGRKVADIDHYGMLTEYKYDSDDRVVASVTYTNVITAAQLAPLATPLVPVELATLRPAANAKDLWAWKIYDKEGRVVETIDGTGHAVRSDYDASGRLVATTGYYATLSAATLTSFKTTPPTTVTVPTANALKDSIARTFYDKSGRIVGMLDGEGYLTKVDYDAGGRKVAETMFATATVAANRASGSFATLTTGLANAATDRVTRYVYDGQGLLVFVVDALNQVTESVYPAADAADVNGLARQTIRYAAPIGAPGAWTVAGVRAALNSAGLATNASNRSDWAIYDNRDRLTYAIDAAGGVTGYKYDVSGNVTKVTRFATTRATTTLPDTATMDSWAAANTVAASDRVTRNYYNARNERRYVVDGEGYVTRTDYDAEGRSITTVGWFAAITVTDSTTLQQVGTLATGSSITTATSYDNDGRVASTTDGVGAVTSYVYDAAGGLLGKAYRAYGSADQVLTQYSYDGAGRVLTRIDAAGTSDAATTAYGYDGFGNVLTTTDPRGNIVTSSYDRAGRQLARTDQEGLVTSYQYNAFDEVVATTDPRGATDYSYYDTLGRVAKTRDADSRITGYAYTVFGEVASVTRYANTATNAPSSTTSPTIVADAARDATVSYAYDKAGRVVTTTDPEAAATTQTYTAFGDVATRTDPLDTRTILTRFSYDRRGLLKTQIVDAASGGKALTSTWGYDAFGRAVTLVDATTATTIRTYDNEGRLATSMDALNNVTSYAYDKRGNLAAVTDALGGVTRYAYDKLDRQIYAVDPLGTVTQTSYDKSSNPVQTTTYGTAISLSGLAVAATASAIAARVTANAAVDEITRSIYDKDGRLRFAIDASGGLTDYVYDGAGNVVQSTTYAAPVVDAPPYTIENIANEIATMPADQLARSATTRSIYDGEGQRTYAIDALGFVTAYSYDARGNVVAQRQFATAYAGPPTPAEAAMATWAAANPNAADRISRALYDRADRLRFDVDGEGYVTQYSYDKASHVAQTIRYADRYPSFTASTTIAQATALVGATPPATAQVTAFAYDSAGRLASETRDPGSGRLNITTGYSYDGNGNVVATTDALGRVTHYVYDALGRQTFKVDAEGAVTKTTYDALGRAVSVRRSATVNTRAAAGDYPLQMTAAQAQVAVAATDRVTRTLYDADGRAIYMVDAEGYVTERRYDALDNVTTQIRYAAKVTVDDSVSRASLAALLPATVPATAIVTGYSYDLNNRLTQQVDDQGAGKLNVRTRYAYDTQGNVVARTDTLGRVTHYVYDKLDRQVFAVDALGYASETRYDAFGGTKTNVGYANRVADAATVAGWPLEADAGLVTAGIVASADDRTTRGFFDRDGRQVYAIDGEGYVTETRYDAVDNVAQTIRYASAIAATDASTTANVAASLPAAIPADAAVVSHVYDRANRLTDTTDPTGSITHFDMNALGQVVVTTVAYGTSQASTTSHAYDRVGRTTSETLAGAGQAPSVIAYNVFGDAITTTDAAGTITRHDYDALGRAVRDYVPIDAQTAHDLTTSKVYDAFGRVVQVTDPNGGVGYFHYDNLDRLTVQVDPEAYVTQTTYTATGEKESVVRYANRATAVGSASAMPNIASSAKDAVTVFGYDLLDQLVATTDAEGYTEHYVLNAFGDRAAVINKLGGVTFNAFDHRGLLAVETTQVRWTDPAQNLAMGSNITNSYAYDARSNLTTKIEAYGRAEARTTQYGYDKSDRLTSTVHAAVDVLANPATGAMAHVNPTERLSYDLRGNLIESIDATGGRTLYYYDGQDRKIAEVNAVGTLTTWQYDGSGNALYQRVYGDAVAMPATAGGTPPSPVASANVRETAYSYDRANRQIATSVAAVTVGRYDGTVYQTTQGVTTGRLYDGLGNVIRETDGNGGLTFHYFDKLGREIAKIDPEGYLTSWQRDAEGNVTLERRYATQVLTSYDQTTPVATLIANKPINPSEDRVTAFTYNRNGQRTTETRFAVEGLMDGATGTKLATANVVIRYTYNALGEVLSKHEATGDTTNYTYDDSGRLVRQQDAAIASLGNLRHTTDFTYDGLNNLLRTRESASVNTSAPDLSDDSTTPPSPPAVSQPVTTTTIGYAAVDGSGTVTGTAANDLIYIPTANAGGSNSVGIVGGAGDDRMINESWNGGIDGGIGNDVLEFRAVSQTATGGAGSDVFVFDLGNIAENSYALDSSYIWATITDFARGVDKIAILNSARSFADLTLTQVGSNVEITMAHAPKIVVRNFTVAKLTADNFIFSRGGNASAARPPSSLVPSPMTTTDIGMVLEEAQGTAVNDALYIASGENGGTNGALLFGRDGDDRIVTESWASLASGGEGNDVIEIRANDVVAIGGSGNDTFVFDISKFAGAEYARSADYVWARIVGFTTGHDKIAIPGKAYGDLTFTQVGADVEITMAGAPRIIVEMTTLAQIAPSDFLFPGADPTIPAPLPTAAPVAPAVTPGTDDRVTSFAYDANGRLTSQTDASGFIHNYAYDAAGRVVRDSYDRRRSDGTLITEGQFTGYDAAGRAVSQYMATLGAGGWASGDVTTTGYDAFGDAATTSINGVVQETNRYDTMGRVIKSNARDGVWREYGYDGNGNVTLTVASNGFVTSGASVGDLLSRGLSGASDAVATYTTYDMRNAATASYEPNRQLGPQANGVAATQLVIKRQLTNAFGEILWDYDARGAGTFYRYNTLGKLLARNDEAVAVTDEHGVTLTGQYLLERYYYDASGRMVGTDDKAGRRTSRTLLEGSGYGDEEALVLAEHRPDGSTSSTEYTVFGDARALIDGLGRRTEQSFDKMGRVTLVAKPGAEGTRLTESYAYDGLGQRIRHANSVYQTPGVAQGYPYYDATAGGTFYLSPSGPYLVMGDTGGEDGTNGGMTMPVTYPSPAPGGTWSYDTKHGYAVLTPTPLVVQTGAGGTTLPTNAMVAPTGPGDPSDGGSIGPSAGGAAPGLETTDYDAQGRVISTVNFAGDRITYAYAWNSALNAGLGVTGGWTRTTSTIADRASASDNIQAATDSTDSFGHLVTRTDLGGNGYSYSFDRAGHSVGETDTSGGTVTRTVTSTYYNTGMLAGVVESGGQTASYGYDAGGNRVYERLVGANGVIKQDGRAVYDMLGRMTSYRDLGADGGADNVRLNWRYDAVGNIRSLTQSYRAMDPTGLATQATADQTAWYTYDSMNRVVISQGALVGTTIQRGWGVELTYDAAGQRRTATTTAGATAPGYAAPGSATPVGTGAHREIYTYSDDGYLTAVDQADAGADGVFGATKMLSRFTRDALGRVLTETDYDSAGVEAHSRYQLVYDNRDQVLSQSDRQRQGGDTFTSNTSNWYDATGTLSSTATQSWKDGNSTSNATTTYTYLWRDSALTQQATLTNTDGSTQSIYAYDNAARLMSVTLTGGQRPRTITLTTDLTGQILTRDESSAAALNPHAKSYFFNGVGQGTVNNDGTDNMTFAAAVDAGTVAPPATNPGPFRGGATFGSSYASFDRQHDAVNPANTESTPAAYTVRSGDTLQSVAQAAWGDANLWYLIAAANGLSGSETLVTGRTLTIPNKIVNRANTSDTFRPYDPSEALGNVQPNTPTPKPQGKKNKCGIFGAILLAVVAIAVTVVTAGALTPALGPVLGGAVAGAAGSVVSQAVGLVTGIQDKFSFRGVALAAIGGAVGPGGVFGKAGAFSGEGFVQGALRGVLSGTLTQGIAVATGLQKKFDWVGIAAGGIAAGGIAGGVSSVVGSALGVDASSTSAANIGKSLVVGLAGDIAYAATRGIVEGSDFGDNIIAGLPSVIAQTVGSVVGAAITKAHQKNAERAQNAEAAQIHDATGESSPGERRSENAAANARTAKSRDGQSADANAAGGTEPRSSIDLASEGYREVTPTTREENNSTVEKAIQFTRLRTDKSEAQKRTIVKELEDRRDYFNSILPAAAAAAGGVASTVGAVSGAGSLAIFGSTIFTYGSSGFQLFGENGLTFNRNSDGVSIGVGGTNGVNLTGNLRIDGWKSFDLSAGVRVRGDDLVGSGSLKLGSDSLVARGELSIDGGKALDGGGLLSLTPDNASAAGRLSLDDGRTFGIGSINLGQDAVTANARLSLDGGANSGSGYLRLGDELSGGGSLRLNSGRTLDAAADLNITITDIGLSNERLSLGGYSLAGSSSAENAPINPMRAGQLAEARQAAAIGSEGKVTFKPSPEQIDSAAFKLIVGEARYTAAGDPVSTLYDSSGARGLGEFKNGSSVLDSSYQLRLQTYGALVSNPPVPYTIYTSRPINPTFNDWLTRWGVTVSPVPK